MILGTTLLIIGNLFVEKIKGTNIFRRYFFIVPLVLLFVLMAGNYNNPDYFNYQLRYETLEFSESAEWLYVLLTNTAANMNITFSQYRVILTVIGLLLIHCTVFKYLENKTYMYCLYFIYPFMMDVTQTRNFMAMAIFIFAVPFLVRNKRFDWIKYVLLIVLAAGFQKTAYAYIPIVFFRNARNNKLLKQIMVASVILSILCGLSRGALGGLSNFILKNFVSDADERLGGYATIQTRFGYLMYWAFQCGSFFFVWWARNIYNTNRIYTKEDEKYKKFIDMIFWINVYAFMFMPLYVFQSTFTRLMRNIVPLNQIVAVLMLQRTINADRETNTNRIAYMVLFTYMMYVMFDKNVDKLYHYSIVLPLFDNNWILEGKCNYWLR